jgi:hypothetical protein
LPGDESHFNVISITLFNIAKREWPEPETLLSRTRPFQGCSSETKVLSPSFSKRPTRMTAFPCQFSALKSRLEAKGVLGQVSVQNCSPSEQASPKTNGAATARPSQRRKNPGATAGRRNKVLRRTGRQSRHKRERANHRRSCGRNSVRTSLSTSNCPEGTQRVKNGSTHLPAIQC